MKGKESFKVFFFFLKREISFWGKGKAEGTLRVKKKEEERKKERET